VTSLQQFLDQHNLDLQQQPQQQQQQQFIQPSIIQQNNFKVKASFLFV
jgi:hypothetical protein